jgi:hypothetical protein
MIPRRNPARAVIETPFRTCSVAVLAHFFQRAEITKQQDLLGHDRDIRELMGGSDPTLLAFSRPNSLWGRSRPLQHDATVALSGPQARVPNCSNASIPRGTATERTELRAKLFSLPSDTNFFPNTE